MTARAYIGAAPTWRDLPPTRAELVTTLPRSLMPWRDHLLAGFQIARTRPNSWLVYREAYREAPPAPALAPEADIDKAKLNVTDQETEAVESLRIGFGTIITAYELKLTAQQARQLAVRHSALEPIPGRARRFTYPVTAIEADRLAQTYGTPEALRAVPHPGDPKKRVLPLAKNEAITCALYCARNSGLPARPGAVASLDDAVHAYLMLGTSDRQQLMDRLAVHPTPASIGAIVPAAILPDRRPVDPNVSADDLQQILEDVDRLLIRDPDALDQLLASPHPSADLHE